MVACDGLLSLSLSPPLFFDPKSLSNNPSKTPALYTDQSRAGGRGESQAAAQRRRVPGTVVLRAATGAAAAGSGREQASTAPASAQQLVERRAFGFTAVVER